MGNFAVGKRALGVCDRCGFIYKLKTLKKETVKRRVTDLKVCKSCFDLDHPQLMLGEYPVRDAIAIRDPRTDSGEYAASRSLTVNVSGVHCVGKIGQVTV